MDRFLLHCLLLAWASLATAWRLIPRRSDRFLAATLLAWANVVATALALAALHRLNEPRAYLLVSTLLAGLTGLVAWRWGRPAAETPAAEASPSLWLQAACFLTLAPLGAALLAAAGHYGPNHPDELAHHLPRALFYLGQGHLGHFNTVDPQLVLPPFNAQLPQLAGLVYGAPAGWLAGLNLLAWLCAGAALYRLGRLAGAGANASLLASWLLLLATPVTALAGSTSPELAAGAALLGAVIFAARWRESRAWGDTLLAGIALGLAAGSSLNVLWFSLGAGLVLLLASARNQTRPQGIRLRTWIMAALLAATLALPFFVINQAYGDMHTAGAPAAFSFPQLWTGLQSLANPLAMPKVLTEESVGFGVVGLGLLLGALLVAFRPNRVTGLAAGCARLGLAWIVADLLLKLDAPLLARDAVPAMLLLGPVLALVIQSGMQSRRSLTSALLLAAVAVTGGSTGRYLLDQARQPLRPLLAPAPSAAQPPVPIPLLRNLQPADWINIDSDARDEALLPFMMLRPGQRFTARWTPAAGAFNLFSRSPQSFRAGLDTLERMPLYAVINFPGKRTAGVEYLVTHGHGAAARQYFGLMPNAGQTDAVASNQYLLATVSADPARPGAGRALFRLAGLHPADNVRVTVYQQGEDREFHALASFTEDGVAPVALSPTTPCLLIKLAMVDTGAELTVVAIQRAGRPGDGQEPAAPVPASNPSILFTTELVGAGDAAITTSEGLQPTEGPYPQWDLPYVRWAMKSVFQITVPPSPGLNRLRLFISLRPQMRASAGLEIRVNGAAVAQYQLTNATDWLDRLLEFPTQPGSNVIEFRDIPANSTPDWLGYLEHNPDVKRYVLSHHIPLEQGAREHYESSGRREGRTLWQRSEPGPETARYFLFRHIRLEGIKSP